MAKVFNKWDLDEVEVTDEGLKRYICLDDTIVPHTLGRHVKRQFAKSNVSIVERLINKMMRTERNSGKATQYTGEENVKCPVAKSNPQTKFKIG